MLEFAFLVPLAEWVVTHPWASAMPKVTVADLSGATTGSLLTVGDIADAVWDEALTGHSTAGSAGKVLADTEANTDIIQAKVNEL